MSDQLNICTFGGLTLTKAGELLSGFASRKAEALFIYLVCNPRPHPRETLATLLWPENDHARALGNLSVVLSSLRKVVGEYLHTDRHTITFTAEAPYTLDKLAFEQALAQTQTARSQTGRLTRSSAILLTDAIQLYKGDFLAGFNLRQVAEFEAWVLVEQERLRQLMIEALTALISFHQERQQFSEGIQYAQQLLAIDPLQEATHQQLMVLYLLSDQRTAALAQYDQCCDILQQELGVEPNEEITALYEQIQQGATPSESAVLGPSASRPLTNVPAATNPFIGREEELAHIKTWLAKPAERLLTIIGQGGIGKTRLVEEAARATVGEFADGVWLVSLVAAENQAELVGRIADAFGFKFSGTRPPAEQLLASWQDKELLLVLDNFEQLLDSQSLEFINQLIQQASEIKLLVTSRERLNLLAESLLELHGLPYPAAEQASSPAADFAAVDLFTQAAQRISDFVLDGQETAVTQLCQLVDGLPLALELAASWIRVLPLEEILSEIQHGLELLSTAQHDVPERHRSMEAIFNQTWEMLSEREQQLYARLSVFRGGITREAARRVAGATLPLLASLTDKSLLRRDKNGRYLRHPLLVQFAAQKLAADPAEQAAARTQHANYFASWFSPKLDAIYKLETATLHDIRTERENLSAAWDWALETANPSFFSKVWQSFYYYLLEVEALYIEGAERFLAAVEAIEQRPDAADHAELQAQLWSRYGWYNMELNQLETARIALEKSLTLARSGPFPREEVHSYSKLALISAWEGNYVQAREMLEESVAIGRQHAYARPELASTLSHLSIVMQMQGEYEAAVPIAEESLEIAQESGIITMIDVALTNLGTALYRLQDYDRAREAFTECVAIARQMGNRSREAQNIHNLMDVSWKLGDLEAARQYGLQALALFEQVKQPQYIALTDAILIEIEIAADDIPQARQHLYHAIQTARTLQGEWVQISVLLAAAHLLITSGRSEFAVTVLSFIIHEDTAFAEHREDAGKLLQQLKEELPAAVIERGEAAVAEHTISSLLKLLSRP